MHEAGHERDQKPLEELGEVGGVDTGDYTEEYKRGCWETEDK